MVNREKFISFEELFGSFLICCHVYKYNSGRDLLPIFWRRAMSEMASRQKEQPKKRRKTSKTGFSSAISCRDSPLLRLTIRPQTEGEGCMGFSVINMLKRMIGAYQVTNVFGLND